MVGKTARFSLTFALLFAVAVLVCGLFLASQIRKAAYTPFWLDEVHGLFQTARGATPGKLLLQGAEGQGSPAPLDYLLLMGLSSCESELRFLGLLPNSYFCLIAQGSMVLAALVVFLLAYAHFRTEEQVSLLQGLLVLGALLTFFFQPVSYAYGLESRPYALWNSLWLVVLAGHLFHWQRPYLLSLCLVLLALTATAAVFQILALVVASALVALVDRKPVRDIGRDLMCRYAVPGLVAAYYCLKVVDFRYKTASWDEFWPFWGEFAWIPVCSALAAAIFLCRAANRHLAIVPLAMLVLYLLAPAIFAYTKYKGFFFTPRQYIYYQIAMPVLFLCASKAVVAWEFRWGIYSRIAVPIAACLTALLVFRTTCKECYRSAQGELVAPAPPWGVLQDPENVMTDLVRQELPRYFYFTQPPSYASWGNAQLMAEWLPVRFDGIPVGDKVLVLEPQEDNSSMIVGIVSRSVALEDEASAKESARPGSPSRWIALGSPSAPR